MTKTPYQIAVEQMGEETVQKLSRPAIDPETGYVAKHLNALVPSSGGDKERCARCGGYGSWQAPDNNGRLCLRCFDDWDECGSALLKKHGFVWSKKKWQAALLEFCATMPSVVDIQAHNRKLEAKNRAIRGLFPEYFA
ncbi:hypothetical protein ES703_121310 [subsurface metagenome]